MKKKLKLRAMEVFTLRLVVEKINHLSTNFGDYIFEDVRRELDLSSDELRQLKKISRKVNRMF